MEFSVGVVLITDPKKLRTVLVTDCGSTTTKALLFEKTERGWRQTFRGEAPTTVEAPTADVTVGAINAFDEVSELSGRAIVDRSKPKPFVITGADPKQGIDLYLSTSSAGGGLQMVVMGLVGELSAASGLRAALGAGAIVLDTVSVDDGRDEIERIKKLRHLKPDIVLLAGGTDGGATKQVVELAEMLVSAAPRPRFGDTLKLPVVFAGNVDLRREIESLLGSVASTASVGNVLPKCDEEDLHPAREAIHEFFLSHVMSHAPGYGKLMSWSPFKIMPTPLACGDVIQIAANRLNASVLAVDIGGATTDVFSVIRDAGKEHFHRTVSANLGMSYSVGNVLVEAGADNIRRWLPYEVSNSEIIDRLRNKMIRPTSIPQTIEDLALEQAVCREALRLSLIHHKSLAKPVDGKEAKGISTIFRVANDDFFGVNRLDLVIGSGGVLSHAPQRLGAALMMVDAFELNGVVELAVDSVFMLPHLGVLASVHPEAAEEIFFADCLVRVSCLVAPAGEVADSGVMAAVYFNDVLVGEVISGSIRSIGAELAGKEGELRVVPKNGCQIKGQRRSFSKKIKVGAEGFLMDGRKRPITKFLSASTQRKIYDDLGLK